MKSHDFNTITLIVAITMTFTVLIISSGPFNISQIQNVSAQPNDSESIHSKVKNKMMTFHNVISKDSLFGGKESSNLTSSVSVFQPIINAFKSYIQVDMTEAIMTAQQSIGNNATTIAAYIHPEGQFIVYNVFVVDSFGVFYKVVVDPGNGQIIDSEKISFIKMMKMFH